MTRGVSAVYGIIVAVGVAIETLGVKEGLNNRIGLDEPADDVVIIPCVVVIEVRR